jgi:histidyl-tRNA synthetase
MSTQPYKGARDFYPDDMQVRNYIFGVWRDVCKAYGYEEYDGPLLESFELYAAKSGEELVNEQLYTFEDRGGRKVAIRPEMTPTLARMIAAKYKTLPLPIRWFSIPNLWRYEKPQKGRLREHFQLNVDIFGVDDIEADFEVLCVGIDIMLAVGAREGMFEIRVGNRRLMEDVYESFGIEKEKIYMINKAIDKIAKISKSEFKSLLKGEASLTDEQVDQIQSFLKKPDPIIKQLSKDSKGAKEIRDLLRLAEENGKGDYIRFDPTIMRGFDYYTGNVFELYDLNPSNKRSLFGGGRYDDLVELFVGRNIPGVGWGMGDVTFRNFLKAWGLLPKLPSEVEYFVTVWQNHLIAYKKASYEVAAKLRELGKNVEIWLGDDAKINKQLKYADKKDIKNVIIIGEEEIGTNTLTVKDMDTGKQETKSLEEFLAGLS